MSKVYFITGAGRGMGVDFVGRRSPPVIRWSPRAAARGGRGAVGAADSPADSLLIVPLDITVPEGAGAAVQAAVAAVWPDRRVIDNAASFQAGFFEEVSPEQFRAQIEVNFFGALNVTRAGNSR